MALTLKQSYVKLLEEATAFFLVQDHNLDQDRKALDRLRLSILDLVSNADNPHFDHFLAYLLGSSNIAAQYPFQCIRLLCLSYKTIHRESLFNAIKPEELALGAFFADSGFRVVWLGPKAPHAEIGAYRIKQMGFPWFTPTIEKIMLHHHNPKEDISPSKIVSLYSQYLAAVYGMGTDLATGTLVQPAKAVDLLLEEHLGNQAGIKMILRTLSPYPLGSWVRLNSGDSAMVVASNPINPLRPRLGTYHNVGKGNFQWEEQDLQKNATVHIVSSQPPTTGQQALINKPHLWIPEWEGKGILSKEDLELGFQKEPLLASTDSPRPVEELLTTGAIKSGKTVGSLSSSTPAAESTAKTAPPASEIEKQCNEEELFKVRQDWQTYTQDVEAATSKLRSGLIESYRRENERYKEIVRQMSTGPKGSFVFPEKVSLPPPSLTPALSAPEALTFFPHRAEPSLRLLDEQVQTERQVIHDLLRETRESLRVIHRLKSQHETELEEDKDVFQTALENGETELQEIETVFFVEAPEPKTSEEEVHCLHDLAARREEIAEIHDAIQNLKTLLLTRIVVACFRKGMALRETGDWGGALAQFQEAVKLNPTFWEAHAYQGLCFLSQKDPRAIQEFEKALALCPGHPQLLDCLRLAREIQQN